MTERVIGLYILEVLSKVIVCLVMAVFRSLSTHLTLSQKCAGQFPQNEKNNIDMDFVNLMYALCVNWH